MSSFNLEQQNKIESKIVVALERVSEAFRVLLWNESKKNALSPIQIQILIFLLFHSQEKCKVSYLAEEFNMTKATVSDSVKVLLKKGLISKSSSETDNRSYTISLSTSGKNTAQKVASFAKGIEMPVTSLSQNQKEVMLDGLLQLINNLNKAGIITIQRMCFSCDYYQNVHGKHYCSLLQTTLHKTDLRIDCPEHLEKSQ